MFGNVFYVIQVDGYLGRIWFGVFAWSMVGGAFQGVGNPARRGQGLKFFGVWTVAFLFRCKASLRCFVGEDAGRYGFLVFGRKAHEEG